MRAPSEDELAAVAVAYAALTVAADTPEHAAAAAHWRLAGRLPEIDEQRIRFAATAASRWNAAGRLDG